MIKNFTMANDWFRFKKFMVKQDKTAMKVGTDGVLLGAWAASESPEKILDIGTGTGLIALMMAQKYQFAIIDAVEIDPDAAAQARENFTGSPWGSRLFIHSVSLQEFAKSKGNDYSLIVCNPPYFSRAVRAPSHRRSLARHDDSLPKTVLLQHVARLLTPAGTFAMILPFENSGSFIAEADDTGLFPNKILQVRPVPAKPFVRTLISFEFHKGLVTKDELIIEEGGRHQYSDAYMSLTREYYLGF